MARRNRICVAALLFLLAAVMGCARYERTVAPFRMPDAYTNATEVAGATIAARAYTPAEAKADFGFDIVGSGVLPVQVIFDNKGNHPLQVVANRTYLVDIQSNLWPVLNQDLAYDRIEKKTELGEVLPEGAKSGMLAGAAGAIIGAAVGIVSGGSVGEAAAKGAAVGAAAGITLGGAKGVMNQEVPRKVGEDLHNRSLENRPAPANDVSHGFIFFPGEAKEQARELRLALQEVDTGIIHSLILGF